MSKPLIRPSSSSLSSLNLRGTCDGTQVVDDDDVDDDDDVGYH